MLDGISFTVKKGELVGVTGPVGSGKSTLAAVLTGLYSYSGEITLEGRSVFELSGAEKAAAFAYSGQDAFLFSASIAQNITFRPSPLTEEEKERLNRSLYLSALNEDIKLFPQGIETQVGEKGIRISGGQRQRIALARAIYTGNPILILDDPFSAVDINTEKEMIERIRQNLRDTTIFIFSHRLAAFTVADRILVLDKGRLIEQGTHEELITGNGIYSKIYIAQKWMEADENE